jgi:cytoskeletal protein CcmA (bactofilin family)
MMLKKTITPTFEPAAPQAAITIVSAGTEIKGKIQSNGDIRIDGVLIGDVQTKAKVLVGSGGEVHGDIQAQQADILGKVTGNLNIAELLCLKGNCMVNGNMHIGQLQVDPSASFNGECHMGNKDAMAQVVAIQQEQQHAAGNQ